MELVAKLAEEQLDEAHNLRSLGNWVSRLSGLFFILSFLAGVALMLQTQRGTCTDNGFGSRCSVHTVTHPFTVIGITTIGVGIFWSLMMALVGSWARAYALGREIESEQLLASRP